MVKKMTINKNEMMTNNDQSQGWFDLATILLGRRPSDIFSTNARNIRDSPNDHKCLSD